MTVMRNLRYLLNSKFAWIPVVLSLLWLGYKTFGPTHYSLDTILRDLADRAVERASVDIPKIDGVETATVLNLKGDHNGYVTEALRRELNRTGKYKVLGKSLYDKLADEFNWQKTEVSTLEQALERGRKIGTDAVIFGEVSSLMQDQKAAKVEMIVRAAAVRSGEALFIKDYGDRVIKRSTSMRYIKAKMSDAPFGWKLFIWLLFTIFLPIATFFIPKRVLREESNFFNFALLLGYTLLNFLFAFILSGFRVSGFWNSLFLIIALGLSGTYNFFALSLIDKYSR